MGYLTKYGSFWGMIPVTSGRIFWVAAADTYTVEGRTYSASDDNDGLSPERALRTVNRAFDAGYVTANVGDVVILLPGAHSSAATITMDVAGVTVTGLPRGSANVTIQGAGAMNYMASVTTSLAAAEVFTVSAADSEITYLTIIPITAGGGIDVRAANANIHDCVFDMFTPVVNIATIGIDIGGASRGLRVANCTVSCDGAQGAFFNDAGSDTITLTEAVIERCTLICTAGTWANAFLITSGATNVVIRDCDFMATSGSLITDAVDITGNTTDDAVMVARCYTNLTVTNMTTSSSTSDIILLNNYIGTIEGGTGGTLRTT